jgi:hypothetical protein
MPAGGGRLALSVSKAMMKDAGSDHRRRGRRRDHRQSDASNSERPGMVGPIPGHIAGHQFGEPVSCRCWRSHSRCRAIGRVEISELREALGFPHPLRGEDVAAELGLARGGRGAELDEGGEEDDPCDHDLPR